MKPLVFISSIAVMALVGCGRHAADSAVAKHQYPVLSFKILQKIPDSELEAAILDNVDYRIGGNYDEAYKKVTGLSKGFQMVYATWWVEAEVNNGGFNQYFWNPAGQFQNEALEGYKLLGAEEHADLLGEAIKIYEQLAPKLSKLKAENTTAAFTQSYKDNPLGQCDDKFYKLKVDTSALRIKYIREHPGLFIEK
jgi:hypothetical protein